LVNKLSRAANSSIHAYCVERHQPVSDGSPLQSPERFSPELIDAIYRKCLSLTITGNYSLKELGELEKLPPSAIRRIDGICRVLEV